MAIDCRRIFIINGKAGSGKDTFVNFQKDYAKNQYGIDIINISTVDKVKEAANLLGWNGVKDARSRKFLSDLKDLSVEYCDHPAQYCYKVAESLPYNAWLYIHCREPEEIEKMKEHFSKQFTCFTILLDRPGVKAVTSNHADADIDDYTYDFYLHNNDDLQALECLAQGFITKMYIDPRGF